MTAFFRDTGTPAFAPIDLAETKAWLRVTGTNDDTVIQALIERAVSYIENTLQLRFASRTGEFGFDGVCGDLRLDTGPISSITSLTYLDAAGDRQTLSQDAYDVCLHGLKPAITKAVGYTWPAHLRRHGSIIVTATVGYANASAIPADLKHAVALYVADSFLNREGKAEGTAAVDRLLSRFRRGHMA